MSNIIKSSYIVEKDDVYIPKIDIKVKKDTVDETQESLEKARKEKVRILEATEREKEKIINDAKSEAEFIIENAKREAEEILNTAKENSDSIEADSREKGYVSGYNEGKEKSDELIKEANDIKKNYLLEKEKVLNSIEDDVIELVKTICNEIIENIVKDDDSAIIALVKKGLDSLDSRDTAVIRISKDDYEVVNFSKDRLLSMANMIEDIEIKLDNTLKTGDCIIETKNGSVDVSIKSQLEKIEETLNTILNSE
ncbi:FliH/SctL family protein [Dethiothermospora halolimnae]|uniref:FliH/SctL family protein n=1 Tax=Dethiothermospora halolimnae TaxID=3114390 RepID=UPI003CCB8FD2